MTIDTSINMTRFKQMADEYFGGEKYYPVKEMADYSKRNIRPYIKREDMSKPKTKKSLSSKHSNGGLRGEYRKGQSPFMEDLYEALENYEGNELTAEEIKELQENVIDIQVELVNLDEIEAE